MALETTSTLAFLQSVHPYDAMAPDRLAQVAAAMTPAGPAPTMTTSTSILSR